MKIHGRKLKLPTISREGQRILEALSGREVDMRRLADLIELDPALSASLIRYANSPLYRRHVEVTNVRNAIHLLGVKNVRLAVVVVIMRAFTHPPDRVKELIWEHAYATSVLARMVAERACRRRADDIALTAMMHDVGALILATSFPDEYEQLASAQGEARPVDELEREAFGVSHGEVVAGMQQTLRLPRMTLEAIAGFTAHPVFARMESELDQHVAVTALANLLERDVFNAKGHFVKEMPASRETLELAVGLRDGELDDICERFEAMANEHYESL